MMAVHSFILVFSVKKFILKIALFFVLVAILDAICGLCFDILRSKAHGGQTRKNEYISKQCKDDILILGSSKADHHYVPSIFEDSLNMTCYNAGEMGCGIIPAYVRYKMVSEHRKPKLVIYELTPGYDYLKDNDYSSYLGVIRQYSNKKYVRDVYSDFSDELESLRLMSRLYRNNSKMVMNIKNVFEMADTCKGYEPLYGTMSFEGMINATTIDTTEPYFLDSLKWLYMEKLVKETKNDSIQLLFIISPLCYKQMSEYTYYEPGIKLCEKYNIPLVNNLCNGDFAGKNELFQDNCHLNHNGALLYSQMVVNQIKQYVN